MASLVSIIFDNRLVQSQALTFRHATILTPLELCMVLPRNCPTIVANPHIATGRMLPSHILVNGDSLLVD